MLSESYFLANFSSSAASGEEKWSVSQAAQRRLLRVCVCVCVCVCVYVCVLFGHSHDKSKNHLQKHANMRNKNKQPETRQRNQSLLPGSSNVFPFLRRSSFAWVAGTDSDSDAMVFEWCANGVRMVLEWCSNGA
jgi:hypothetical protein